MVEKHTGIEKRMHVRKNYPVDHRPTIRIGLQEFDVIDISERGVRFVNDKKIIRQGWVNGTILFKDRISIAVDGVVVRDENGDMGLHLVAPIDPGFD